MTQLASMGQLRGSLMRWALVLVPGVLLFGLLSAQLSGSGANDPWFVGLSKPALNPSPMVFALVWIALYLLTGLALSMVAAARGARWRSAALAMFAVQFLLNIAWSPLFFGGHRILAAFVLLVALDVAVVATIALFRRVRPVAAFLLVPYLAWILFATLLTWQIHVANPGADGQDVSAAVTRIQI
jgi:tryptophan-rich sensory protein